jgi:uncharacterized protein YecE (DUF72 family)
MIRLGTCSWKYDSWRGIFYSDKKNINYLEEYAKQFSTVEIDQWFWSLFPPGKVVLPDEKTITQYKNSVPADFLFTIKVPNSITLTHFYTRNKNEPLVPNPYFLSETLFEEFLRTLKPIENNIGCLIFQFEYLNKQKISSLPEFQEKISRFKSKISVNIPPVGIEIRNPNYLKDSYFEFLNKLNFAHVFLEGYYMPPVKDIYKKFGNRINNFSILRLHGPDRKGIEKLAGEDWSRIYIDRTEEINTIVEMIKQLEAKEVDLFVNVNNHFEGSAPLTIERIKNKLKNHR